MRVALAALLALATADASAADPGMPVVFILIDGLRPDAIAAAPAPELSKAMTQGPSTLVAHTVEPSETLPAHVSMATGVPPSQHGVITNKELGRPITLENVFSRVHASGGTTALYHGKSKLMDLAEPRAIDVRVGRDRNEKDWSRGAMDNLARTFADDFSARGFAFTWIHLREPDLVGHKEAWMSPAYLAAVREADVALGVVLRAIAASPHAAQTAIIVTADHGGHDKVHWDGGDVDELVPWVCIVPGVRSGAAPAEVTVLDVPSTILALLRLPPLPGGTQPVKACLAR